MIDQSLDLVQKLFRLDSVFTYLHEFHKFSFNHPFLHDDIRNRQIFSSSKFSGSMSKLNLNPVYYEIGFFSTLNIFYNLNQYYQYV